MRRAARLIVPLALAALTGLTACGSAETPGRGDGSKPKLTVLAAASLKESFTELAEDFTDRTGIPVRLSFAGSSQLAAQIRQGAPADVLATADRRTMDGLGTQVGRASVFATNRLVIAVRPGNPKKIRSLADLARPNVLLVLAAEQVPAGRYAAEALHKAGVTARPKSREPDVRAALTKVRLGEADAAIVYTTDAVAAGKAVQAIPVPPADNVRAEYPIAPVAGSEHPTRARKFSTFVASPKGTRVLKRYGFGAPS
jgi:molybdate transport system substrate-binding protein